ncbi:MAG: porin [Brachymonas sp.]|nr:porin [Brachymonas sp.]
MKKTLVAMAAMAAVSAFAQSTATLYGRIDLGYNQATRTDGTNAGTTSKRKTTQLAGGENRRTTSRIGLRGSEDLGGGLKANFNWEARMGANGASLDDTSAGLGNIRQANISLTGGFGAVVIGTYDNALDSVRGYSATGNGTKLDLGARNAALAGNATYAGAAAETGYLSGKSNNAIAYRSPNFGGFTVGLGTVNEKVVNTDATGAQTSADRATGYMIGASYSNGPLSSNFAYGSAKQNYRYLVANYDWWRGERVGVRS